MQLGAALRDLLSAGYQKPGALGWQRVEPLLLLAGRPGHRE